MSGDNLRNKVEKAICAGLESNAGKWYTEDGVAFRPAKQFTILVFDEESGEETERTFEVQVVER